MIGQRLIALAICALGLAGCGGGVNLYAQPTEDFKQAVDVTAQLVTDYAGLERHLLQTAATGAVIGNPKAKLIFKPTQCAVADPGSGCVIVNRATGQPVVNALAFGESHTVGGKVAGDLEPLTAMVGKLQRYARLLSSIAQASTKAQLETGSAQTSQTYNDLYSSVASMKRSDLKTEGGDYKEMAIDALASMYVESERTKALLALVEQADPVVVAVSNTLGSFVSDIQNDYVLNQKDRVMQLVLTFNVMSVDPSDSNPVGALTQKVMRRQILARALAEQVALQAVMSIDAKGAFAHMKAAHAALLAALRRASSPQGQAEVAIAEMMTASRSFTAAALKASNTMNALKGLM